MRGNIAYIATSNSARMDAKNRGTFLNTASFSEFSDMMVNLWVWDRSERAGKEDISIKEWWRHRLSICNYQVQSFADVCVPQAEIKKKGLKNTWQTNLQCTFIMVFCNGLILVWSCSSFEIDLLSFKVLLHEIIKGGRADLMQWLDTATS